jgi:hypothetical protein
MWEVSSSFQSILKEAFWEYEIFWYFYVINMLSGKTIKNEKKMVAKTRKHFSETTWRKESEISSNLKWNSFLPSLHSQKFKKMTRQNAQINMKSLLSKNFRKEWDKFPFFIPISNINIWPLIKLFLLNHDNNWILRLYSPIAWKYQHLIFDQSPLFQNLLMLCR